jgi:hypothetical protein
MRPWSMKVNRLFTNAASTPIYPRLRLCDLGGEGSVGQSITLIQRDGLLYGHAVIH